MASCRTYILEAESPAKNNHESLPLLKSSPAF